MIIRALNTRGGRKDDVALLMARLNGIEPEDVAEWRLSLDPVEAGRARTVVREQLHDWGLARLADPAESMVSELVTNAVRHAHSRRHHPPARLTPCCARWPTTTPPCRRCSARAPATSSAAVCVSSARWPVSGARAAPAPARPCGSN